MGNRSKQGHWAVRKVLSSGQIVKVWIPQGSNRRKKQSAIAKNDRLLTAKR